MVGAVEGQITVGLSDPRNDNAAMSWTADVSFPDGPRDIMLVTNAMPFLANLPAVAEAHGRWSPALVVSPDAAEHVNAAHRSNDRCALTSDDTLRAAPFTPHGLMPYGVMLSALEGRFVSLYQQLANPHAVVVRGTGFDLLRYRKGQRFGLHVDVVREHPVLGHRRLAVVAFCNEDFEGGALHFPRQNVTIQPKAGSLVMFPASFTHPHEAREVTEGLRYSVVTWFL